MSELLIDLAIRESLRPAHKSVVPRSVTQHLLNANKFVLDERMSSYLADLTNAAFVANPKRALEMVDGARRLGRLPHPITWIEYDCRARRRRSDEAYPSVQHPTSGSKVAAEEIIPRVGWLLTQHSKIPTAYVLTEVVEMQNSKAVMLPYSSVWVSDDDSVLPWRSLPFSKDGRSASEAITGILGYRSDKCGCTLSPAYDKNRHDAEGFSEIIHETAGELRAAWTLLATINDLPTLIDTVRPSKGYVARGRYRKFVEHSVIKLNVPAHRSLQTLAARAVATIRRRAHKVRGHWRKDWRHRLSTFCQHEWSADEHAVHCIHCGGRRTWIADHQRGDASLGIVTHDYQLTHDKPQENPK